MPQLLETERALLRPFQPADAAEAFSWFGDAEVMRHIPLGADQTSADSAARIGRYIDHQNRYGFSKWVIIDRESQKLVGDSGLYYLPDGKRVELGYRLARAWWGRGLATEVAQRWIEAAHEFTEHPTLHAFAHPENAPSLQILRKLGFTYLQHETFYGLNAPVYTLPLREATSPPESILRRQP